MGKKNKTLGKSEIPFTGDPPSVANAWKGEQVFIECPKHGKNPGIVTEMNPLSKPDTATFVCIMCYEEDTKEWETQIHNSALNFVRSTPILLRNVTVKPRIAKMKPEPQYRRISLEDEVAT